MSFRQPVPLDKAFRLMNHGPTLLISAMHDGIRNVMAASWGMPLDYSPPKVAIVLDKKTLTRELIEASGEFTISVPTCSQLEMINNAGTLSGKEIYAQTGHDKLIQLGIATIPSATAKAPLIEGCVAWLECRLLVEPKIQKTYDLFLGEVVAASADSRVFSHGHWDFSSHDELRTVHYETGGNYMLTGPKIRVS